jgi:hypothetical protein
MNPKTTPVMLPLLFILVSLVALVATDADRSET